MKNNIIDMVDTVGLQKRFKMVADELNHCKDNNKRGEYIDVAAFYITQILEDGNAAVKEITRLEAKLAAAEKVVIKANEFISTGDRNCYYMHNGDCNEHDEIKALKEAIAEYEKS